MNMPITVEIADPQATEEIFNRIYDYLHYVENKFSVFKPESEISQINAGKISAQDYSDDMKQIFSLAEETRQQTNGYFNIIDRQGKYNPSGIVKGWAIYQSGKILLDAGFKNFYINAGGDIQVQGKNPLGQTWQIGIKNPFNQNQNIKIVWLSNQGIATSGTYIRGQHIYNPFDAPKPITDIISLTVIGPNIYEADRMATAAFAMGRSGLYFIESLPGFEGYLIDSQGQATLTSHFNDYT